MVHHPSGAHPQRRGDLPRSGDFTPVIAALVGLPVGRPVVVTDDPHWQNDRFHRRLQWHQHRYGRPNGAPWHRTE